MSGIAPLRYTHMSVSFSRGVFLAATLVLCTWSVKPLYCTSERKQKRLLCQRRPMTGAALFCQLNLRRGAGLGDVLPNETGSLQGFLASSLDLDR